MNLLSDIRFALRLLVKNPGSSAMAILVMAVGTGVAITMFAFVNGVLWSPLQLNEKREIQRLQWAEGDQLGKRTKIDPLDLEVLREEAGSFDKMTGWQWGGRQSFHNPSGEAFAKIYNYAWVATDFFDFIEQPALIGRTFLPEDVASGEENAIVISYRVWQEHFGGDEDIIGALTLFGAQPVTVIGVMPPGFLFPSDTYIWVASNWQSTGELSRKQSRKLNVIGVLENGVSQNQAKAELNTIAGRLAQEYPETNEKLTRLQMTPYTDLAAASAVGGKGIAIYYILLLSAVLVLGVASANVFNLVMTRNASRTSELSVRSALGASRAHIVLQVLLDGMILTVLGALGGTLIAGWSLKLLWAKFSQQQFLNYWWHMDMDVRVMGFVISVVVISALASSLIPGLRASRTSVSENLKDDARTSSGLFIGALAKIILGFQVVVTGVLAFVNVMMLMIWMQLQSRDLPSDPGSILNVEVRLYGEMAEQPSLEQLREALGERLATYPGFEAVAFSRVEGGMAIPNTHRDGNWTRPFEVDGEIYQSEESKPRTSFNFVTEGFASVFGVEPLAGRNLNVLDTRDGQAVCMVNKAFADYHWPDEDPIGKRIKLLGVEGVEGFKTVVGVMPNIMPKPMPGDDLLEKGYIKMYLPYSQIGGVAGANLLLRTKGDPHAYEEILRSELKKVASNQVFAGNMLTLQELWDRNMVLADLVFSMFGVFGFAALVLGVVGLYAVMSFTTRQRFREFGIRMALGATSKEIMMTVVKRGVLLLSIGGIIGVGAGHALSMVLRSTIDVHDLPLGYTYPIVVAILVFSTAFSMGVPAWRASRISPNQALRVE